VSFEEEKERVKRFFSLCCPEEFLCSKPTKLQLKKLACMVAGAIVHDYIKPFVYFAIQKKYLSLRSSFAPKTIDEACNEFVEYCFEIVKERCYERADFVNKKFIDTYNIASRMFYRERFAEAIDKFNLDALEKPPLSYILNIGSEDPYSCEDKNTILIQFSLKNHKSLEYYVMNDPAMIDEVFTRKAINQLLQAFEYSGLWDMYVKNIFINVETKKITYIDFEYNHDVKQNQLFNKDEIQRKSSFLYAIYLGRRMFSKFPRQKAIIENFIDKHCRREFLAFLEYIKSNKKEVLPLKPIKASYLGFLLCSDNTKSKRFRYLSKKVYEELIAP